MRKRQELRHLQSEDLKQIREWRNNPEINRFMFSQHIIGEEEHKNWFKLNQENELITLLMFNEGDRKLGFLQFQQQSFTTRVMEWGFYISPAASKGTGSKMINIGIEYAFNELKANKIYAEILDFNIPSINLHKKFGFTQEGLLRQQHNINGSYHDVFCFGLLLEQWQRK